MLAHIWILTALLIQDHYLLTTCSTWQTNSLQQGRWPINTTVLPCDRQQTVACHCNNRNNPSLLRSGSMLQTSKYGCSSARSQN